MKTILVHMNDDDGQAARIQAAIDLGRAHGADLNCLQVVPIGDYIICDPIYGSVDMTTDLLRAIREGAAAQRARLEPRIEGSGLRWDWSVCETLSIAQAIANRSHLSDLVVVSCVARDAPSPLIGALGTAMRTPMLAVPPKLMSHDPAAPVAVAWNGSREAAYALRASLALLRTTAAVHVVEIDEGRHGEAGGATGADACAYLTRRGLVARHHKLASGRRDTGDILIETAVGLGAGAIVMGAYGHSRAYEYIWGGVTRHMLAKSPVPLVLAH